MNSEEIQSLIEQLKAQGLSEEEIMDVFYQTFVDGEMDRKDLETLADAMGYELTDEFKNELTPDPINAEGAEGMSKEELEDAKEIEPGESAEEFKDKLEGEEVEGEAKEEEKEVAEAGEEENAEPEEDDEAEEEVEEEDEYADWEKSQKMFKI